MRSLQKKNRRRGYTLVLFVFFMMMSIALAALVIDVAFVRLTKRQMQTMTDAAALYHQREKNSTKAWSHTFEAGPDVQLADGVVVSGNFRAQAKWEENGLGAWVPALQVSNDDPSGDIIRGTYQGTDEPHVERSVNSASSEYYVRDDFKFDPTGSDVLVRLRRTGESLQPGGSAGPPVPFLFGRGLIMGGSADVWNRIERGTILRQTSIARQSPARFVGPYVAVRDSSNNLVASQVGLINVRVNRSVWQDTIPLDATTFEIFDSADVKGTSIGTPAPTSSGSLINSTTYANPHYTNNSGYVLITENLGISGHHSQTVVGFGYVQVDHGTNTLTRLQRRRYHNTSTTLRTDLSAFNLTQLTELIKANRDVFVDHNGISAPALVRSE